MCRRRPALQAGAALQELQVVTEVPWRAARVAAVVPVPVPVPSAVQAVQAVRVGRAARAAVPASAR